MAFELRPLPYAFGALEPVIDAKTMEIHHGKHHAAYVTNLNKALEGLTVTDDATALIADLSVLPADKRTAVRNNAGGHVNHTMFWNLMATPGSGGEPSAELSAAITSTFGSLAAFQEKFAAAGLGRFGSGWAWLVVKGGKLEIGSTANQDSPLMGEIAGFTGTPILGLDVWEHAYYLNYQNRRADYIAAWWKVVNWKAVSELYAKAK